VLTLPKLRKDNRPRYIMYGKTAPNLRGDKSTIERKKKCDAIAKRKTNEVRWATSPGPLGTRRRSKTQTGSSPGRPEGVQNNPQKEHAS